MGAGSGNAETQLTWTLHSEIKFDCCQSQRTPGSFEKMSISGVSRCLLEVCKVACYIVCLCGHTCPNDTHTHTHTQPQTHTHLRMLPSGSTKLLSRSKSCCPDDTHTYPTTHTHTHTHTHLRMLPSGSTKLLSRSKSCCPGLSLTYTAAPLTAL